MIPSEQRDYHRRLFSGIPDPAPAGEGMGGSSLAADGASKSLRVPQVAQAGRAKVIPSAQRTSVKRNIVQSVTPMRVSAHPDRRRSPAET